MSFAAPRGWSSWQARTYRDRCRRELLAPAHATHDELAGGELLPDLVERVAQNRGVAWPILRVLKQAAHQHLDHAIGDTPVLQIVCHRRRRSARGIADQNL